MRPLWAEPIECQDFENLTDSEKKELKPIERMKLIMTRGKDDEAELYNAIGAKEDKKMYDTQFKYPKSNFRIAIVVDMWLTGFDVPCLDTIYIDKPIQQHSLIQTISRVNRVYEGKEKGLVVDYIGIKRNLNTALKKYSAIDEDNFEDISKAISIVKEQLELLESIFHKFNSDKYFKSNDSVLQLECLKKAAEFIQQTDDTEKRFMHFTKKMRKAYNLCCSSEEINSYERDKIHYYFAVRSIIQKICGINVPDISQMNKRVRQMLEEALISDGIEEIFKFHDSGTNIDIFSDEYMAKINNLKLPNTKIKLLQNLLNKAINDFKKVNKIRAVDFSGRLKSIISRYNERKEQEALANDVLEEVAEQLTILYKDLKTEKSSFIALGISFEEKAFYDILKAVADKYKFEYPHEKLLVLSKAVKEIVDDKSGFTDWADREDIKSELKVALILILDKHGYPPVPKDDVFKEIFEQAENFKKYMNE